MKGKNSGTMKILKKLKKRMGSLPLPPALRKQLMTSSNSSFNQGPLQFHPAICGENIRLSLDGSVARRVDGFCKGIVFGNRPVKINEYILLKLAQISTTWNGNIRFGLTNHNPSNYKGSLPKFACPDLTNRQGYWAKLLPNKLVKEGAVLFYFVDEKGNVHYGINDEEMGIFFSGVDTRKPLWPLIDIYGNTTALQLIDPRQHISNFNESCGDLNVIRDDVPTSKYYTDSPLRPMPFHSVHGQNIRLSKDRSTAARDRSEYSRGYVFTQRPLRGGEQLVIKILENVKDYYGSLTFGMTSCDPAKLRPNELPEDCDLLLDRKEYWVVLKDAGVVPKPGDELSFIMTTQGEILFSKNNGPLVPLIHVDNSQKLWAFFDVYGVTLKIQSLGWSLELPEEITCENDSSPLNGSLDNGDCVMCYERPVNSVLYTCGHMCMCYECAKQHFKKPSKNHCPICRAKVKDIIRIYRS